MAEDGHGVDEVVGRNIRQSREATGMTQHELAEALRWGGWQIDDTAITRIESGARSLRVSQLTMVAVALGVSPASLLASVALDPSMLLWRQDVEAVATYFETLRARKSALLREKTEIEAEIAVVGQSLNEAVANSDRLRSQMQVTVRRLNAAVIELADVEEALAAFSAAVEAAGEDAAVQEEIDRRRGN